MLSSILKILIWRIKLFQVILMKIFKKDFGIEENKEDVLFEMFANYCIISIIHPEAFSTDFDKPKHTS